jgi:glucose-1-phosphate thymidylyltransferase
MKGIILAGGNGSRLHPLTSVVTKQLLPVYDKPMIHYPLATLILAGIKDILIICKKGDDKLFKKLLGTGSEYGIKIQYKVQDNPNGIPEAFILGEEFIGDDSVCLALGDNIFHGHGLPELLQRGAEAVNTGGGAVIFGHHVKNPERYGIVKQGKWGKILNIEEKPKRPKSNCAVVGLYMYDNSVIEIAKNLKPSGRGETEITDVNREYLQNKKLRLIKFGRGYSWFDTGVADALLNASNYVQAIQNRQGLKISCIEETAHYMGFIDDEQLRNLASKIKNPEYSNYLYDILNKEEE